MRNKTYALGIDGLIPRNQSDHEQIKFQQLYKPTKAKF